MRPQTHRHTQKRIHTRSKKLLDIVINKFSANMNNCAPTKPRQPSLLPTCCCQCQCHCYCLLLHIGYSLLLFCYYYCYYVLKHNATLNIHMDYICIGDIVIRRLDHHTHKHTHTRNFSLLLVGARSLPFYWQYFCVKRFGQQHFSTQLPD